MTTDREGKCGVCGNEGGCPAHQIDLREPKPDAYREMAEKIAMRKDADGFATRLWNLGDVRAIESALRQVAEKKEETVVYLARAVGRLDNARTELQEKVSALERENCRLVGESEGYKRNWLETSSELASREERLEVVEAMALLEAKKVADERQRSRALVEALEKADFVPTDNEGDCIYCGGHVTLDPKESRHNETCAWLVLQKVLTAHREASDRHEQSENKEQSEAEKKS